MSPLKKFGFVDTSQGSIKITELGKHILQKDFDWGDIFLRILVKWQLPNPLSDDFSADEFDTIPFISTLHLIKRVNELAVAEGYKAVGISLEEFRYFVPCLCKFEDIENYAKKIVELRKITKGKKITDQKDLRAQFYKNFLEKFLNSSEINSVQNNTKEYADNTLRYFRLTRLLHIRGNRHYIDLEPGRTVEILSLLQKYDGKAKEFSDEASYISYISNISDEVLPWKTIDKQKEIYAQLVNNINEILPVVGTEEKIIPSTFNEVSGYENEIARIRQRRQELLEALRHRQSQATGTVEEYIAKLENIYNEEDRPIMLEKYTTLGFDALNDALEVHPNYPLGDDNEPTFTAPAGKPDIECYYEDYNSICEVTMLTTRDQWFNEGQPVMRHLREFENKNEDKTNYCIFIAPSLHTDTINTFWFAIQLGYDGKKQNIIPMTIKDFIQILLIMLECKKKGKQFEHKYLESLYQSILEKAKALQSATEWVASTSGVISNWKTEVLQ